MAVDSSLFSLYEELKVEDPWLPPRPWESIPSESGVFRSPIASCSPCPAKNRLFDTSSVSEASLVRLALNSLQGLESAVISIIKLSAAFCSDPADRSSHRNNGLWNRSSSTHALGNILKSIGFSGCMVLLLRKFVGYCMNLSLDGRFNGNGHNEIEARGIEGDSHVQVGKEEHLPFGLVNQAFAVAVNKVLEGYTCALDTLYASAGLRRSSEAVPASPDAPHIGSLTSVVLSKVTLLEVYLHTKEVRTQIEALGSICKLHNVALGFSRLPFEALMAKAAEEFANFPRGSDLLSYLHEQLQVADPTHRSLLKFLFVQSCEPYFGFIRSWIFKAEINDPYKEFMVEYVPDFESSCQGEAGYLPGASVQVRVGVSVPCFLQDFLVPVIRAGQQLQVLMKLFELCNYVAPGIDTYDDFLPCWKGFSDSSRTSPLTFSRRNIETLVLERNNYYNKMQEKLEEISAKLEFRYHQVGAWGTSISLSETLRGNLDAAVSFMLNDSSVSAPAVDGERVNMNSDGASSTCEADLLDSSDCSSSDCSDEQTDFEELIRFPNGASCPEEKYLSALKFSQNSVECYKLAESDQTPCHQKSDSHDILQRVDILGRLGPSRSDGIVSSYHSVNMEFKELTQSFSVLHHDNTWLKPSRLELDTSNRERETAISDKIRFFRDMEPSRPSPKDGLPKDEFDIPSSLKPHSSEYRDFNFLSKNPMLSIKAFTNLVSKPGASLCSAYRKSLPCFQFSSVEDAVRVYVEKLDGGCIDEPEYQTLRKGNSDKILVENTEAPAAHAETGVKEQSKRPAISSNISGGSRWESLLGTLREPVRKAVSRQERTSSDTFEIPLDFIIDKCILQEIWLQYKYVSKLTIKLLDDGFDLQQHLLSLRRYHLMEVADWADLFIMSLSRHKSRGFVIEAEQRSSDIQGLLEASIQRSSCESDNYKNRLFVYFEEHDMMPLSTSTTGTHAFDFLRLGYRVNWPVSIILTPSALKIYAEIFNFLLKVKLAIFSLTDSWCLLKDSMHQTDQNCNSRLQEVEPSHVKTLINTRHQLNHFISMLQQYVQSQLSHVSWSRFRQSLKHKVKDMMDLETVHMEYLTDSLHACFLSEEAQVIGGIIKNVLQYALDFRGCLVRGVHDTGARTGVLDKVQTIRQKFDEHMEELQRIYNRSPKHGKFGVSHFWGFLNYNDFYSNRSNQNAFFF